MTTDPIEPAENDGVEFVDQERAYADAAEFVELQGASGETRNKSWLALTRVGLNVGPASNVGVRYACWVQTVSGRAPRIDLRVHSLMNGVSEEALINGVKSHARMVRRAEKSA